MRPRQLPVRLRDALNGLNSYESFLIATTPAFQQNDGTQIDVEQLIMQLIDETRRRMEMQSIDAPANSAFGDALAAFGRGRGT